MSQKTHQLCVYLHIKYRTWDGMLKYSRYVNGYINFYSMFKAWETSFKQSMLTKLCWIFIKFETSSWTLTLSISIIHYTSLSNIHYKCQVSIIHLICPCPTFTIYVHVRLLLFITMSNIHCIHPRPTFTIYVHVCLLLFIAMSNIHLIHPCPTFTICVHVRYSLCFSMSDIHFIY